MILKLYNNFIKYETGDNIAIGPRGYGSHTVVLLAEYTLKSNAVNRK